MSILLPNTSWATDNSANEITGAYTSLTASPSEITLSENINNFSFEPLTSPIAPTKASVLINTIDYVSVGDTVTITSTLASVTLTASSTPSSNEFYTESVSINTPAYLSQVAASIADALTQSVSFNNNYDIELLGYNVVVTAKQYGDLYDFTASDTSTGLVTYTVAGTSEFESQNVIDYQGFCEVYIGSYPYAGIVDKYECTLVDDYILDTELNSVNVNIPVVGNFVEPITPNKILTSYTTNYFAMDQGLTDTGAVISNVDAFGNTKLMLRPYFVAYGDSFKYVTNGQRKKYIRGVSEMKWVQLGAFDKLLPYNMNDYTFIPNSTKSFRFLSSCPNLKTVSYDSHEFVQMIVKQTVVNHSFNLYVRYNFYDGTSYTENKTSFAYAGLAGNVSMDVSPAILGLATIEAAQGKLIDNYSIQIKWSSNGTNERYNIKKTYVMDRTCYDNKKQVIFLNEFGGWDSLEFRGEITEGLDRDVLSIERVLPYNANTLDAVSDEVSLNINTYVRSNYTLRSGLINDSHIEWIKKLGESSAVYIWDPSYNKYRSILLSEFDFVNNTISTSDSVSITFNYTTSNNSISR